MLDVGCWILVGCGSPLDRFYADDFGAGPGRLGLVLILTLGIVSLGAAVGAAAAELLGGAQNGAVQAGFVALEAGQDGFRAVVGVALGDEGEAAVVVEGAIPAIVIFEQAFVFVLRRRLPCAAPAIDASRPWRSGRRRFPR